MILRIVRLRRPPLPVLVLLQLLPQILVVKQEFQTETRIAPKNKRYGNQRMIGYARSW
jgi:hypothetical protein